MGLAVGAPHPAPLDTGFRRYDEKGGRNDEKGGRNDEKGAGMTRRLVGEVVVRVVLRFVA